MTSENFWLLLIVAGFIVCTIVYKITITIMKKGYFNVFENPSIFLETEVAILYILMFFSYTLGIKIITGILICQIFGFTIFSFKDFVERKSD